MNSKTSSVKASVCPLDCADTCSLDVTVEGTRVAAVRGSTRNPFTRGKLCAKVVRSFPEQVHGDRRGPRLRGDQLGRGPGHDF